MVLRIVGIGPGSVDYITPAAINAVKDSDIVFGSKRAVDLFPEAREVVFIGAGDMEEKLAMAAELGVNKNVSILSTGDPGFSGVLKPVKRIISDRNIDVSLEVIPGVSSVQLCAARLLIPWDDANILTFHGREEHPLNEIVDNGKPTIILPSKDPSGTADFLIRHGLNVDRRVTVCERLGYPDEKIVTLTLGELRNSEFSYMSLIVLFEE